MKICGTSKSPLFCQTEFSQTSVPVLMQSLNDSTRCAPFDSSVGRAEDCRSVMIDILRSLVQLRLEGGVFRLCLVNLGRISGQSFQACGVYCFICYLSGGREEADCDNDWGTVRWRGTCGWWGNTQMGCVNHAGNVKLWAMSLWSAASTRNNGRGCMQQCQASPWVM